MELILVRMKEAATIVSNSKEGGDLHSTPCVPDETGFVIPAEQEEAPAELPGWGRQVQEDGWVARVFAMGPGPPRAGTSHG